MKLVISHMSALRYWRAYGTVEESELLSTIPLSDALPKPEQTDSRSIADAACSIKDVGGFAYNKYGFVATRDNPLDILVPNSSARHVSLRLRSHVWSERIIRGSLCRIKGDLYVCSPEFLYVQFAAILSQIELAQLAVELCGTYSLSLGGGMRDRTEPLTSVRKLTTFVDTLQNVHGTTKARHTLRWVTDNSRSPMETNMFLALCLPRRMGGFGLPLPKLNPTIEVGDRLRSLVGGTYYRPDCLWEKVVKGKRVKVTAEYDSHEHHDDTDSAESTRIRRNSFKTLGYLVTSVNKSQMKEADAFQYPARQIARDLGLRRPELEISEISRCDDLLSTLMREETR